MQIDWLTVAAQIVNFLVLVWLLQRFLYGPITRAMRQREDRIETRLSDAREKRQEAEREAERLKEERADLAARRDEILEDARREAEDRRKARKEEIDRELNEDREAMRERLRAGQDEAMEEIRKRAAKSTFAAIRHTLRAFADAGMAEEMARRFGEHLGSLEDAERERLAEAAGGADATARVETAIDLPSPVRGRLTRTLHEVVDEGLKVEYVTDPDLLLGLRLTISGQVAEWSAAQHLDRLEEEVRRAISDVAGPAPDRDAA